MIGHYAFSFFCFLSMAVWVGIVFFYRKAYLYKQIFTISTEKSKDSPFLSILIPARNEAEILRETLPSLLEQEYSPREILLIDDHSTDQTYQVAQSIKEQYKSSILEIVQGKPLETGWAGKLWALNQGLQKARGEWILLTDADLHYEKGLLPSLMNFAFDKKAAMVSLMAKLRTKTFWEKLLIPAFLYFFKLMYPFASVNNPSSKIAAAAGGCILIQKKVLEEIGGLKAIQDALIDDISLAKKVKEKGHPIYLLDGPDLISKRGYDNLKGIWNMVARSAFTELKYSYARLMGCIVAMLTAFAIPMLGIVSFLFLENASLYFLTGATTWIAMTITYIFSIRYFALFFLFAFTLPLAGILYLAMTIDSARRYFYGTRSQWKDREYKTK